MTNIDCVISKVKGEKGIDIADEDIQTIVTNFDKEVSKIEKGNRAKLKELIDKLVTQNGEAVDFSARNKLMNLKSRIDFIKKANKLISDDVTYLDVLEAELVGANKNVIGFRDSVDARHHAIKAEHTGNTLYQLEEAGLTKLVTSNKFDSAAVAKELYLMDKETTMRFIDQEHNARAAGKKYDVFEGFDAKVGSGDKEAYGIAKIMSKELYRMATRANRNGAYIKIRPDYIVKQTHDASKLYKAGFDEWYKFIRPLIDDAATLENVSDEGKFFRNIYEDIVHGKTDLTGGVKLKAGVANKVSRERTIHFKSDVEFMKYNNVFGKKDLMDTYINTIMTMSRDIALMEKFGPDPERNFETLIGEIDAINRERRIEGKYSEAHLKAIHEQEGDRYRNKLRNYFDTVSGKADIPVLGKLYAIGREIRALHNLSKLGGAGMSAIADVGFMATEASYQGIGFMHGLWNGVRGPVDYLFAMLGNKSSQQRVEIAKLIGVGMDGLTSSTMARFSINDGFGNGIFSRWQRGFFKLNGLNFMTDSFKSAFSRMASSHLASKSKMVWGDLGRELTNVLSKYNIGELEWNIIRKTVFEGDDGNMFITPDKVRYLTDDILDAYISKKYKNRSKTDRLRLKVKDDLETSLRSYFVDRADYASPTPGAKEKAIMYRGMRPGSVWGEVARFFWQYKSFALTAISKVWGRETYGRYSNLSAVGRMAGMLGITTATGIVAMSAKEIVRGQVPRAFTLANDIANGDFNGELLFNVVSGGLFQGGGVGIYGDLLQTAKTSTRYGQSMVESMLGPTGALVGDVGRMVGIMPFSVEEFSAIGSDKSSDKFLQATVRLGKSIAPLGNYPGMRNVYDNFIWYKISESINPGYIRRLKRAYKKHDVEYYFGPLAD